MKVLRLNAICLLVFVFTSLYTQQSDRFGSGIDCLEQLEDSTHQMLGINPNIIRGRLQTFQYPLATGHPFFNQNGWSFGSILSGGKQYHNLMLLYDLLNDELHLNYRTDNESVILILEKGFVNEFIIHDTRFRWIDITSKLTKVLNPGYYEVVYEGEVLYLIKRAKLYLKSQTVSQGSFIEKELHYLVVNDQIFRIKGKYSLLAVLKNEKSEIKKWIKQQNLSLNKMNKNDISRVVIHYEQLNNQNHIVK